MKKQIPFLLILLLPFMAFSEKKPKNKMKFGDVPIELLKMKTCELDSTADAVIIGDFHQYEMTYNPNTGLQISFEVYQRIKILTNEGIDKMSDFSIRLYIDKNNGMREKISLIKATTYNLEGEKIIETKLDRDSRFIEENDGYDEHKFAFENVKVGSVLEYKFIVTSDFISSFPTYYPQREVPVLWSELWFQYFEEIEFKYFVTGRVPVLYNNHELLQGLYSDTWVFKDIPAVEQDVFMGPVKNYTQKVDYELKRITIPGKYYRDYTTTWQEIGKDLMNSVRLGELLDKKRFFTEIVDHVLQDTSAKTTTEKVQSALNFIHQNYQWNSYNRLLGSSDFGKVVKDKTGNSADLNILLMGALQELGIKVRPVALSTRSHGFLLEAKPSTDDLNYLITCFEEDGKKYLVDAATDYSGINALPEKCLNGKGVLLDKNYSGWINLDTQLKYAKKIYVQASIDENALISGTYQAKEMGYASQDLRGKILEQGSEEEYIQNAKEKWSDFSISEYSLTDVNDLKKDVGVKFDFSKDNQIQDMGELWAFEPILFKDFDENPFKKDERIYPVDFVYPSTLDYTYIYTLPENFVVEELPKPTRVSNQDKTISFLLNTVSNGNTINVSVKFKVDKPVYYAEQYDEIKSFFNLFVDSQKQLILIKPQ